MSPSLRGSAGNLGELEVIGNVPCPNCRRALVQLPRNYPMYDVQCSGCSFRAQVKTCNSRPKDCVFGAGWDIVQKVLKAGFLLPPLFINFRWREGRVRRSQIIFFPFVPSTHLAKWTLSSQAKRAGYRMFNYVRLSELPQSVVFEE